VDFTQITFLTAFVAGVLSFVSPCVLPLVPAYLSFISGLSAEEIRLGATPTLHRRVIGSAVAFILGLSVVFTLLGASASAAGQLLFDYQPTIARVGGVVIILLGLHMAGILRIPLLYREKRLDMLQFRNRGYLGAFLIGGAFGIGWTPCVGAVLGSILLLASQSETVWTGSTLLFVYSLGLGLPFLAAALAVDRTLGVFGRVKRHFGTVSFASGGLLVVMGILVFTDRLSLIAGWFIQTFGTGLVV
jgi:cytochrome c-type biogenesis protein